VNFYVKRRRKPEIIIVSLIDIFAILLIFMVMTTQFKEERPQVTIKLPESKSAVVADKAAATVVLSVSADEEIFLDAKKIEFDSLKTAIFDLLQRTPPPALALNADKKAPFGTIIRVLDVLKDAGVKGNLSAFTETKK
jgi:biopolymer transport protein ExbD